MKSIATALLLIMGIMAICQNASAQYVDERVMLQKEAALPSGSLPAWQTADEKRLFPRSPSVPLLPGGPLPPPPPAGYRAVAEFEPVSAFLVSYEWHDLSGAEWGDWSSSSVDMLLDMALWGSSPIGAPVIVLTRNNDNTFDPLNGDKVESFFQSFGVLPERMHIPPPGSQNNINLDAKWARDFGPISVYEGGQLGHLAFTDLHYYDSRPNDDAVPGWLTGLLGINRYGTEGFDHTPADAVRLYMEGGNYQTDGDGTCILSDDIPSDNSGNPDADTFSEVEDILADYLGCEQVIWLSTMPNNGTGHVDMSAKLLSPTDILVIDFPNSSSNDSTADAVVESNVTILLASTNMSGNPFTVHRIVIPSLGGGWTYRTYTNSVMLNNVVLVPTYGYSTEDQDAIDVYQSILGPDYAVIGIDSSDIVSQGGAIHCTTMQIASACGNGVVDDFLFEECDGSNLNGQSCSSLSLGSGTLGCSNPSCRFDVSGCSSSPCGNGTIDYEFGEQCDGTDFADLTCADFGFTSGDLTCTGDCLISSADCDADADTDSDTDSDTDTDADTDSDTDSDSDSDSDSDGDTGQQFSPSDDSCGCDTVGENRGNNGLLGRLLFF